MEKVYEKQGSPLGQMIRMWDNWYNYIHHNLEDDNESTQGIDILYLNLEPKFKWFKPPLSIKIFKWEINMTWAYKIHKAYVLKNCVPASMSSSDSNTENKEMTIDFQCKSYTSDKVMKMASNLKNKFKQGPLPSLANDWDGDYIWDQTLGAFRAPRYEGEEDDKLDIKSLIMDPKCDLLLGNYNENSSDKQYPNCIQCHRYEICREYFSKIFQKK